MVRQVRQLWCKRRSSPVTPARASIASPPTAIRRATIAAQDISLWDAVRAPVTPLLPHSMAPMRTRVKPRRPWAGGWTAALDGRRFSRSTGFLSDGVECIASRCDAEPVLRPTGSQHNPPSGADHPYRFIVGGRAHDTREGELLLRRRRWCRLLERSDRVRARGVLRLGERVTLSTPATVDAARRRQSWARCRYVRVRVPARVGRITGLGGVRRSDATRAPWC